MDIFRHKFSIPLQPNHERQMPAGQVGDNGRMRHNGNQGILAGLIESGIVLGQDQQDFVVPPGKVLLRHTEVVFPRRRESRSYGIHRVW